MKKKKRNRDRQDECVWVNAHWTLVRMTSLLFDYWLIRLEASSLGQGVGTRDEKLGWLWEEKSTKHDQKHNFKNTKNNDNLGLIKETFGGKRTIQYT